MHTENRPTVQPPTSIPLPTCPPPRLLSASQGVLLQVFTKPLGDRPTVFFEIIQRLCLVEPPPAPAPEAKVGLPGRILGGGLKRSAAAGGA